MNDLLTRIKVLGSSVIAWLTVASAVLTVVLQELKQVGGVPAWLTRDLAAAAGVIGVIVLQVRRVTPVPDELKGLLPPKGPAVDIPPPGPDQGQTTLHIVLIVLAIIALAIWIFHQVSVK